MFLNDFLERSISEDCILWIAVVLRIIDIEYDDPEDVHQQQTNYHVPDHKVELGEFVTGDLLVDSSISGVIVHHHHLELKEKGRNCIIEVEEANSSVGPISKHGQVGVPRHLSAINKHRDCGEKVEDEHHYNREFEDITNAGFKHPENYSKLVAESKQKNELVKTKGRAA